MLTGRSGDCQLSIQVLARVADDHGDFRAKWRDGSKRPRDTYGGPPFRLRETRTRRNRPGSRILSHPFPQSLGGRFSVDGREEGADPTSPELIALGFREVGVSNQECLAISGDGPRE